jgi:hypothetical protein
MPISRLAAKLGHDSSKGKTMNILADIAGASGLIVLCAITLKGLISQR